MNFIAYIIAFIVFTLIAAPLYQELPIDHKEFAFWSYTISSLLFSYLAGRGFIAVCEE